MNYLTDLKNAENIVIANMSFQFCQDEPAFFKNAVEQAKVKGVIMVAGSGDVFSDQGPLCTSANPTNLPPPAKWSGVLAIGASSYDVNLNPTDLRSSYSIYHFAQLTSYRDLTEFQQPHHWLQE